MGDPSFSVSKGLPLGQQMKIRREIDDLGAMNDLARYRARKSLVSMGSPAVPALIEALDRPNHLVRWGAVKALVEIGDPANAPVLVKILEGDVFDIRWIASEGLIGLGVVGLVPLLEELVEQPQIESLRESAHHILHMLSQMGMETLLAPLMAAMRSPEPSMTIPAEAQRVLRKIRENSPGRGQTTD